LNVALEVSELTLSVCGCPPLMMKVGVGVVGCGVMVAPVTVAVTLSVDDCDPLVAVMAMLPAPKVAVPEAVTCTVVEDEAGTVSGLAWKARVTPEGAV
jgi:hypothetical protein